jgi:hypothetical protein
MRFFDWLFRRKPTPEPVDPAQAEWDLVMREREADHVRAMDDWTKELEAATGKRYAEGRLWTDQEWMASQFELAAQRLGFNNLAMGLDQRQNMYGGGGAFNQLLAPGLANEFARQQQLAQYQQNPYEQHILRLLTGQQSSSQQ